MNDSPTVFTLASNPRNLELLTDALNGEGYTVEGATSLSAAKRLLDGDCHVALVDVDGFSGEVLTLVEAFHKRRIPVIVLSRRVSSVLRRRVMDAGGFVVLEKPVSRGELSHRLHILLPNP